MTKLTAKDLVRFSITVAEANSQHITVEDLKGITEIVPKKKYRIVVSNGFKKDGSRDRISETFEGTLIESIERKKEIIKDIENLSKAPRAKELFSDFVKLYCNYLEEKVNNRQLDLTTYESYYNLIQKYILPHFEKMITIEINERDIEKWIAKLQDTKTKKGKPLHATTIAHAFKVLHNMFNYGKLDRILRENPCEFVHKKPTESPDEKEVFTIEEMDYIKELLLTANIRFKTAMFLLLDTGCRREEIIGLKWEDIDFVNNTIDINKAVVATTTKAPINKHKVREKGVKSRHSKRRIHIPKVCINLLVQYRNFKKDSGLKVKENDYVFTNWNDNTVWDPNRFTTEWLTFRRENNITKNVNLHGIRHSIATYLLSKGMPKKDVAKRMGHTPEVLDRVYTHSNEEDDIKLVEVIEERYNTKSLNLDQAFKVESIISIIAGYIDNEYRKENYRILDYLTDERIDSSNLDLFLSKCQEYLIEQFPILEIFKEKDIIKDEIVLNDKMTKYAKYLDDMVEIKKPTNEITIDKIKV